MIAAVDVSSRAEAAPVSPQSTGSGSGAGSPATPSPPSNGVGLVPPTTAAKSSAKVGEARFVGPGVLAELLTDAEAEGMLTVQLDSPGPGHRGRLGVLIEA